MAFDYHLRLRVYDLHTVPVACCMADLLEFLNKLHDNVAVQCRRLIAAKACENHGQSDVYKKKTPIVLYVR